MFFISFISVNFRISQSDHHNLPQMPKISIRATVKRYKAVLLAEKKKNDGTQKRQKINGQ